MLRSLMTAASGMKAQQMQVDTIANNIANAETPGYKRVEVNFEALLRRQLANQEAAVRNVSLAPPRGAGALGRVGHIALTPSRGPRSVGAEAFLGRELAGLSTAGFEPAPRNDGNNVDLDREMTDLATTQLQFAGLSTALATRLRTVRSVIENV